MSRGTRGLLVACMVLGLAHGLVGVSRAQAQPTTIAQDMTAAIGRYVAQKSEETIKEQSKRAIVAAYKQLYRSSGADKRLLRVLGTVALSAEQIDTLADNMAKATVLGDPEGVKGVGQQVALALGEKLLPALSDPQLRGQMGELLGSVDKANEIADVVGQAAGGDTRAAVEFVGRALIMATPAAAIFTAGETAVGVMKYANEKFTDDSLEDLYRRYVDGDADERAQIRRKLESNRVYSYIVRDRRMELAARKEEAIRLATADLSDRLRDRLLKASEGDVIDDILRNFAARAEREHAAAVTQATKAKAAAEARAMLEALDSTACGRWGKDWSQTRSYDLDRYMEAIRERMRADGTLDPDDPRHIAAMSRLLSTRLVHGANSEEYRRQLADFEEYRRTIQGNITPAPEQGAPAPASTDRSCNAGSPNRNEADRLWRETLALEKRGDFLSARKVLKRSLALCDDKARVAHDEALRKKWMISVATKVADGIRKSMPPIKEITTIATQPRR